MYAWLKPRALLPMHGEPRHMFFHEKFAKQQGIAETLILEDGKIARLCPGPVAVVDEVSVGVLHVDGKLVVDGVDGPARQRRKLSHVGLVVAQVLVDERLQLAEDVEVVLDGVPPGLAEELAIAAEKAFDSLPKTRRKEDEMVEDAVRTAIRRAADLAWGKKPVVKVLVARV
jgi:ribonuclease J